MRHSSRLVPCCSWLLILATCGCGDGSPATPSATGGSGGDTSRAGGAAGSPAQPGSGGQVILGGNAGQWTAGTGALDPGLPLIERTASVDYDCTIRVPTRPLQIPSQGLGYDSLAASGEASFLARAQASSSWGPTDLLSFSTLSTNATAGASTTLKQLAQGYFSHVSIFAASPKLFVFAVEALDNESHIVYARLSAEGAVEVPPTSVTSIGGNGNSSGLVVAPARDGFGLLWGAMNGANGNTVLDFGILRFDGSFENPAGYVDNAAPYTVPSALVATNQGFLASYTQGGVGLGGSYVRAIDSDGTVGEATSLATTDGFSLSGRHSFLWRGTEALLAWSRTEGTSENEQLGSTISLTRLGADAKRRANDLRVSAWVRSQENIDPIMFAWGNDVGLAWSQGSVIYICAGCMPDNHLKFAIFDGATYAPRSSLLEIDNSETAGGLISPAITIQGNDIVMASVIGYHTSSEFAAGTIACAARP